MTFYLDSFCHSLLILNVAFARTIYIEGQENVNLPFAHGFFKHQRKPNLICHRPDHWPADSVADTVNQKQLRYNKEFCTPDESGYFSGKV